MISRLSIAIFICVFTITCKPDNFIESVYDAIQGETMGTYYRISYQSKAGLSKEHIKSKIDSILFEVNDQMSTYIDSSFISEFNKAEAVSGNVPFHFEQVFNTSKVVHQVSEGNFDPTVMPLANYWGFGYSGKVSRENWDSTELNRILSFVGLQRVTLKNGILEKEDPRTQLDFSAIAKGYAADELSKEMIKLGIINHLVDIGGDGYAQGKNKRGKNWSFGINTPDHQAAYSDVFIALAINKKGLATSGNYRNFYEVDGELYGHTINIKTGFPYKSNVLSASIIANSAMEADALATACMASSLEAGISMIEQIDDVEAFLIYKDELGKMNQKYTAGFKDYILE